MKRFERQLNKILDVLIPTVKELMNLVEGDSFAIPYTSCPRSEASAIECVGYSCRETHVLKKFVITWKGDKDESL